MKRWILVVALGLTVSAGFVACSSTSGGTVHVGGPCTTKADCEGKASCYFPIKDACSAKGTCFAEVVEAPSPTCGHVTVLCACDGTQVATGCPFPDGYATGPASGKSDCLTDSDGGGGVGGAGNGGAGGGAPVDGDAG